MPTAPAYGVYVSQLKRYGRACSWNSDILQRDRIRSTKPLYRGFLKNRLILSFQTFLGRYKHLVEQYSVSCVHMRRDDIRQLDFSSTWLTVGSLLCLTTALYTI
jgi:hypothetical protein